MVHPLRIERTAPFGRLREERRAGEGQPSPAGTYPRSVSDCIPVAEVSGGTGGFDVHAITSDDAGHGIALLTGAIRDFVRPVIHVWHVEDGLLTEYGEANLHQHAEDTFWTAALRPV